MKKYYNPEMELYLVSKDVITASGSDPADNLGNDGDFSGLPAVGEEI